MTRGTPETPENINGGNDDSSSTEWVFALVNRFAKGKGIMVKTGPS